MYAIKQGAGFSVGASISCFFALKMDDLVYQQVRRHVIVPLQVLGNSQNIGSRDLIEVGYGTKNLLG